MQRNAKMHKCNLQNKKTRVKFVLIFTPNGMRYVFNSDPFRLSLLFKNKYDIESYQRIQRSANQFSAFIFLIHWFIYLVNVVIFDSMLFSRECIRASFVIAHSQTVIP